VRLDQVGEVELIRRLIPLLPARGLVIGPGEDDAAAWEEPDGSFTVASSDSSVESVHFDLGWQSPEDVGWRALASALGDLAAKGARPAHGLVSLSAPRDWELDRVLGLYRGVAELAGQVGLSVVGGDTTETPGPAVIAITVLGRTRTRPLPRSAAKPGWALGLTGPLGAAALALESRRSLRLGPRIEEGERLNALGLACGDVSDGLLAELQKFQAMSGCGSEVREQLVPVAEGATIIQALTSGEEAELLCAGPPDIVRDAGLAVIGALREGGGVIVLDAQGGQRAKPVGGYQHFA
jgi:thiamine-monophosphate kinase